MGDCIEVAKVNSRGSAIDDQIKRMASAVARNNDVGLRLVNTLSNGQVPACQPPAPPCDNTIASVLENLVDKLCCQTDDLERAAELLSERVGEIKVF